MTATIAPAPVAPSQANHLSLMLPHELLIATLVLAGKEPDELPAFLAGIIERYLDTNPPTLRELDHLARLRLNVVELPFPSRLAQRLHDTAEAFGVATDLVVGEALLWHLRDTSAPAATHPLPS